MNSRTWIFLWVILFGSVFLPSCIIRKLPVVSGLAKKYDEAQDREFERIIAIDKTYAELADLCQSLGDQQKFSLVRRSLSSHGPPEVYYYFHSDVPLPKASSDLRTDLSNKGWISSEDSPRAEMFSFHKDDRSVYFQYGGMGETEYSISCAKISGRNAN